MSSARSFYFNAAVYVPLGRVLKPTQVLVGFSRMKDLSKHDESAVEELKALLRNQIALAEVALHERIERLRAFRDEATSRNRADEITLRMKQADRDHYAAVAPLRAHLDQICKAQAAIRTCEPITLVVTNDSYFNAARA